jgi:hypothetical protein
VQNGRIVSTLSDRAGDLSEKQDQKTTLYGIYLQQSFGQIMTLQVAITEIVQTPP